MPLRIRAAPSSGRGGMWGLTLQPSFLSIVSAIAQRNGLLVRPACAVAPVSVFRWDPCPWAANSLRTSSLRFCMFSLPICFKIIPSFVPVACWPLFVVCTCFSPPSWLFIGMFAASKSTSSRGLSVSASVRGALP